MQLTTIVQTRMPQFPSLSRPGWIAVLGIAIMVDVACIALHLIIHSMGPTLTVTRVELGTIATVLSFLLCLSVYMALHIVYFALVIHRPEMVGHIVSLVVYIIVTCGGSVGLSYLFGIGLAVLCFYLQALTVLLCTVYCKYLTTITLGSMCHTITFVCFILYSQISGWFFFGGGSPLSPFDIICNVLSVLVWWYSHIYILYYLDQDDRMLTIPAVIGILTSPMFLPYIFMRKPIIYISRRYTVQDTIHI
jgi:hypothetical protein